MEKVNVSEAHEELMYRLFGSSITEIDETEGGYRVKKVARSTYSKVLKDVQDEYGLEQGHPDFLEWVFTCVGRSPTIIGDNEEGDDQDEHTRTH